MSGRWSLIGHGLRSFLPKGLPVLLARAAFSVASVPASNPGSVYARSMPLWNMALSLRQLATTKIQYNLHIIHQYIYPPLFVVHVILFY